MSDVTVSNPQTQTVTLVGQTTNLSMGAPPPQNIQTVAQQSTPQTVSQLLWGNIEGDINNQLDLQAEFLNYAGIAQTNLVNHTSRVDNPHATTAAQVGLGNVANLSPANMPVSTSQAAAIANVQAGIAIVQRAYAEYTLHSSFTTIIPIDDTIPQITEGTEILNLVLTPKAATNRFRVRAEIWGALDTTEDQDLMAMAIFHNATANALAAQSSNWTSRPAPDYAGIVMEFEYVPGTTSAETVRLRVGVSSAGKTLWVNGDPATRYFGGVARCTLRVDEIQP